MQPHKTRGLPAKLDALRRPFGRWREAPRPCSRIPDALWFVVVKMLSSLFLGAIGGRQSSMPQRRLLKATDTLGKLLNVEFDRNGHPFNVQLSGYEA